MAFLHGVEVIELPSPRRPIRIVRSAVIALIGTAPKGAVQGLTVVRSKAQSEQFGKQLAGFSIPQALQDIFAQGAGAPVVVVNVFNPATDITAVEEEAVTVAQLKFSIDHAPISGVVVKSTDEEPVTYVLNEDYTFDEFGNFQVIASGDISEGDELTVDYNRASFTGINAARIIGSTTGGVRTGLDLYDLTYSTFGFKPKVLLCPNYNSLTAVRNALLLKADKYRSHALIDAPSETTVEEALAGRTAQGTINFFTANKRAVLLYPHWTTTNNDTGVEELRPFSPFFAGIISRTDALKGFSKSPSNETISGVVKPEVVITWDPADKTTEANALNEVGVVTYGVPFGGGYVTWGNRTAAWPSSTDPSNFMAVQRVADILHESLELATVAYLDGKINDALIDAVRGAANQLIRSFIQEGHLIDGECTYNPADNPAENIAAGQLRFALNIMPPPPFERATFESLIDISLLEQLGQA